MARKLKTYTTSAGFFDLAVAAPSMKAALEAWGSSGNLFHQGFAQQCDDPEIVAATIARPGVVLRRAVGSDAPYSEKAALPTKLPIGKAGRARAAKTTTAPSPSRSTGDKAAREAALGYERERKRREREMRKEEAAREKARERRDRAIAAAEAALEAARQAHEARVADLEKARSAIDEKEEAEKTSWERKQEQLSNALRRARSPKHPRLE